MKSLTSYMWLGAAALIASGCAKGEVVTFEQGGAGGTTTPAGGQGGAEGGAGGSAGEGGGYPCGYDCSQIATDQCHEAVCDVATGNCAVQYVPVGTPCDDSLFCTVGETCSEGLCGGGTPNDCGMSPPACTQVSCHESSQSCTTMPSSEGSYCVPTDLCVVNAACQNGLCVGNPKDCLFAPVPNECHISVCNPANGNCEPEPGNDGQTCTDSSDLCTVSKHCDSGACIGGQPMDCSYLSVGCQDGVCNPTLGQCEAQPIPPGSQCAAATDDCNLGYCNTSGQCVGQPQPGNPCTAATDDCNQGVCNASGQCVGSPVNEGGPCDDGLSCTTGTTCTGGVCGGGTSTITIYFSEDFSSNSAGWTLGPEWAIGPTFAGPSVSYGNPDPATDHSSTADNGVAGVVLGGNASTTSTHDFYYLESPPVDVAAAPVVYLEFWRWLNSDYTPYMANRVEVFNGTGWVVLWTSGSSPGVQDAAWTPVSFDLTPHKNAQLRVRFGFNIGSTGVFTVSSWNVDDVVIASGTCS